MAGGFNTFSKDAVTRIRNTVRGFEALQPKERLPRRKWPIGASQQVVLLRGTSQGIITHGTSGIVDNLVVLSGNYTIPASGEVTALLPTIAFDTSDNAPTWVMQVKDGTFEIYNSECIA